MFNTGTSCFNGLHLNHNESKNCITLEPFKHVSKYFHFLKSLFANCQIKSFLMKENLWKCDLKMPTGVLNLRSSLPQLPLSDLN